MSDAKARAKIEHELEILRTRYALMHKWGRITQWFFVITTGVITVIAICAFSATWKSAEFAFSLFSRLPSARSTNGDSPGFT